MFLSPGSKLPNDGPLINQISLAKHTLLRLSRQRGLGVNPKCWPFEAEAPVRLHWSTRPRADRVSAVPTASPTSSSVALCQLCRAVDSGAC